MRLEIEPGGLKPAREKPTREELLSYYVRFVLDHELNVQTEETVVEVQRRRSKGGIEKRCQSSQVVTDKGKYEPKHAIRNWCDGLPAKVERNGRRSAECL